MSFGINGVPLTFWIAPDVGGRNTYVMLVEANGGKVVDMKDRHTILLVDRESKLGGQMARAWDGIEGKVVLDVHWLDDCISKGRLLEKKDNWGGWRASKVHDSAARDVPGKSAAISPPMTSRFRSSPQTPSLSEHSSSTIKRREADLGRQSSSDMSVPGTPSSASTKFTDEVSRPTLARQPAAGPSAGPSRKRKSKLARGLFARDGVSFRFCVTHEVGNRTDIVKMIEDNGGKVIGSASVDGANFAILPLPLQKLQHCTEQIVQADKDGIPIVKKSWIEESVEEEKLLDHTSYINATAQLILQKQLGLNKPFASKSASQVRPSSPSLPRPPTPNRTSPLGVVTTGLKSSFGSSTSNHNPPFPESASPIPQAIASIPTQTSTNMQTRSDDPLSQGVGLAHIHTESCATREIVPSVAQTATSRPTSWAASMAPLQRSPQATSRELEPLSISAHDHPHQDPPSSPIDGILPAIKIPTAPAIPSTPMANQETRSSVWQNAAPTQQQASQSPVTPTALAASGHQPPVELGPLVPSRIRNFYTIEEEQGAIAHCRERLIQDANCSHARMARDLCRMFPRHSENAWYHRILTSMRAELAQVTVEAAAIREQREQGLRDSLFSHGVGDSVQPAGPSDSSPVSPAQPVRRPPPSPSSTPSLLKKARIDMAIPPTPVLPPALNMDVDRVPSQQGPSRPPPTGTAPSEPSASSPATSPSLPKPNSTSATSPPDVVPPVTVPGSSSSANHTTSSGTSPYERDLHTIVNFFANMDESIVDSDMAWDALPSVVKHSCETQATWEAFYSQHEREIVRLVTEGD